MARTTVLAVGGICNAHPCSCEASRWTLLHLWKRGCERGPQAPAIESQISRADVAAPDAEKQLQAYLVNVRMTMAKWSYLQTSLWRARTASPQGPFHLLRTALRQCSTIYSLYIYQVKQVWSSLLDPCHRILQEAPDRLTHCDWELPVFKPPVVCA